MFTKLQTLRLGAASALMGLMLSAQAAVPVAVTDALDTASDDTVAVAALVIAIVVGILAFKWIRKALT